MGLYTFLYENLLYRLYTTGIQPPLLVTARLSRYTAHTAHTAIQPYTPYIIQRHTASLRSSFIKHIPPTTVRLLPPDLCPSASLTGAMPRSGEASRAAEKAARGADRAAAEARAASARAGSGGGHRTGDVRSSRHIVGWPLVLEDGA